MRKEEIISMAQALKAVREAKLDKVDKSAALKKFKNRDDKDIDNDGNVDNSDRYLHKRRKAVTKNVMKGKSETETQVQEETGMHFLDRYKNKLSEAQYATTEKEPMHKVTGPAQSVQPSKEIRQKPEESKTKDTSRLDKTVAPAAFDGEYAIDYNEKSEDESMRKAAAKIKGTVEQVETRQSKYGGVVTLESRKPASIRDALAMMEERSDHTRGATPPQPYDQKWSPKAKEFADKHPVETPDEADIGKAIEKNSTEVAASLNRKVDYRHNDQTIGDKKPVGNDGK